MKFTGHFYAPRLNLTRYQAILEDEMGNVIARTAAAWLGAVVPIVPVWSGASRATFLKLASETSFQLAMRSRDEVRDRFDLGLSNSEGGIQTGDFSKGIFTFTYATSLKHLIYNEFNNANISPDPGLFGTLIDPGPYHFQQVGQDTFRQFAGHVRLPDPFQTLTVTPIRVG